MAQYTMDTAFKVQPHVPVSEENHASSSDNSSDCDTTPGTAENNVDSLNKSSCSPSKHNRIDRKTQPPSYEESCKHFYHQNIVQDSVLSPKDLTTKSTENDLLDKTTNQNSVGNLHNNKLNQSNLEICSDYKTGDVVENLNCKETNKDYKTNDYSNKYVNCRNSRISDEDFSREKDQNSKAHENHSNFIPESDLMGNQKLTVDSTPTNVINTKELSNQTGTNDEAHRDLASIENKDSPSKFDRKNLDLNLNNDEGNWKGQKSYRSKLYENPIHENDVNETDLLLGNGQATGIVIQPSEKEKNKNYEERPVLHVQFDKDRLEPNNLTVKDACSNSSSNLSSSSSSSSSDDSIEIAEARPPDGGWGWVVVAASFIVNLIADGITFSFGVIFVEFLNYFGENRAKTAWIGSLFMAMPLLSGPIASFLTDRYGCRRVTIAGSILACAGFVISATANTMEVLFITFGVLAGFGLSLCYVASVVIVAYYFDTKRSLATGLSVCGSGIGTFIFAPLTSLLLKEYGWRGTTLILAGLFLNLAVCGALMRDLPWTSKRHKKRAKERKQNRSMKRKEKKNESSADTFSVSNSTNTASVLQPILENGEREEGNTDNTRLCSSLLHLPTFVRNGEKVPMEVIELLSTHKNVYDAIMQTYPNLLTPSRSFSDSGRLNDAHLHPQKFVPTPSPLAATAPTPLTAEHFESNSKHKTDATYIWWLKRNFSPPRLAPQKKFPPAYLKDLRVHRLSLTYRGAMLNINRYRLRASSCPDIYRNSMTTIAKEKSEWYLAFWDFWDVIADMFDFSHFSEPKFLLFAISNFLLYTWYDIPYVYLTDNALEIGYSEEESSFLIAVIGIVNMFGEIILGWAGDQPFLNAGSIYAVCMALCGVVTGIIPFLKNYAALVVASGAFGLFIAANYSLTCVILVELITLERFTNAYGLLLLVQGLANLIGPPLGGWLCDITGTYNLSFYLAGIFIALSGLMLVILPATKRYRRFHTIQRQISSENSIEGGSKPKKPKFYQVLASCITGKVQRNKENPENHV